MELLWNGTEWNRYGVPSNRRGTEGTSWTLTGLITGMNTVLTTGLTAGKRTIAH
jgi:hypothetical protein